MILDIIFAALMVIAVIAGAKQGLIKSVWKIGAWVITGIAVYAALNPAANFLHGTQLAGTIYDSVYSAVAPETAVSDSRSLSEITSLPEWMVSGADEQLQNAQNAVNTGIEAAVEATARTVTDVLVKIIAAVGLFILIRLILAILFAAINGASKLPVVNGLNSFLGAVFSALNILLGVYLALALISLFANPSVYEYMNGSYVVKYMFNNNILMSLFMDLT